MASLLLSVTFACGVLIAVVHVLNRRFIAPGYDVVANLTAFACATAASLLLAHWIPALLSAMAFACWLWLARRTILARAGAHRVCLPRAGRSPRRSTALSGPRGLPDVRTLSRSGRQPERHAARHH